MRMTYLMTIYIRNKTRARIENISPTNEVGFLVSPNLKAHQIMLAIDGKIPKIAKPARTLIISAVSVTPAKRAVK